MPGKGKILFLVPYPLGKAPSQRFRFEQYFTELEKADREFTVAPFLDDATWDILYKPGLQLQKAMGILKGFLHRIFLLFKASAYQFIFIHREAAPIGPPVFEWFLAKVLKKKIIYDFDDAIWLTNTSENNKIAAGLKWHHKVDAICRWAYKVSCGNAYLCNYARHFNDQVVLNPTTIDTEHLHNPALLHKTMNKIPVIGWTGTHSTLPYLEPLMPVLRKLEQEFAFEFCVIANKDPDLPLKSFRFVPWQKETEMQDLVRFDIGLMPLTDDKWAKGKCGFKALQYMALGVPALVSPVGVNTAIVEDGVNGFVCNQPESWEAALRTLLQNASLREYMGKAARGKIIAQYSVLANTRNFLALFR